MYIKSLIGAATMAAVGCVVGAGAAAADGPSATVTVSGWVITANIRGALGYPTCVLDVEEANGGPKHVTIGTPLGPDADVHISSNRLVPGAYSVNVACANGDKSVVLVRDQAIKLALLGGVDSGSLGLS